MANAAYISGSLGQALFFQNNDIFLIEETSINQPIVCTPYNINLFLNHTGELKKIDTDDLNFDKVASLLADETEKWEALDLALNVINPLLNVQERAESLKVLSQYIESDKHIFDFIENRLLGIPLDINLDVNLAIEICQGQSNIKVISDLYLKLLSFKGPITRIYKAFRHSIPDFITNNKQKRELEILLIDKGIFKSFADALINKSKKDFESVFIVFSKDEDIRQIISNSTFLFQEIEKFIARNWEGSFVNEVTLSVSQTSMETDQVTELIQDYLAKRAKLKSQKRNKTDLRKKRTPPYDVLENVKSQLEKIELSLFKNKLAEVEKIIIQVTKYQIKRSDPEHLIKTYSDIATKALKCYYFPLAEKMLYYSSILDNNDPVVHSITAEIFRKQGFLNKALDVYNNIVKEFPTNVIAKRGRAETLRDLGRFEEALEAYDHIISEFPNNPIAESGRAETLRDLGRLQEALKAYDNIIVEFPDNKIAKSGHAETLRDLGRFEEALNAYNNIIIEFPNNVIAKNGRAETLRDLGRLTEALKTYNEIIIEFPNNVIAKSGYAETLRDLGRFSEALETYDNIISEFTVNSFAKNGRAETLRDLGRLIEALKAYDDIIVEFPNDVIAKSGRAETLRDLGKFDEALESYDNIINEFPNNVVVKNGRAETLRDLGRLTEALETYNNIMSKFPYDTIAKSARLALQIKLDKYDEFKAYLKSLKNPKTSGDWVDYHTLSMYYIKIGDYDTAIKRFKFGLENCTWYVSKNYYRKALSFAYLQKNMLNESLELLLKDIIKPVDHLLIVHAHAANNQRPEAIKHMHIIQDTTHPKIHLGVLRLSERYNLNGFTKTGKSKKELDKEIFEIEFDLI